MRGGLIFHRIRNSALAGLAASALSVTAVVLCWSLPALAATPAPAAPPTSMALSVAPGSAGSSTLTLVSQLEGGSSLGGRTISFFVVTKEFGNSLDVPIGTAKTASDGTASVTYKPTWSGSQPFVAKLAGAAAGTALSATTSYTVAAFSPGPLYSTSNPSRPLSSVGHIFVAAALALVALVWLTLISFLVMAGRLLPRFASGGRTD